MMEDGDKEEVIKVLESAFISTMNMLWLTLICAVDKVGEIVENTCISEGTGIVIEQLYDIRYMGAVVTWIFTVVAFIRYPEKIQGMVQKVGLIVGAILCIVAGETGLVDFKQGYDYMFGCMTIISMARSAIGAIGLAVYKVCENKGGEESEEVLH